MGVIMDFLDTTLVGDKELTMPDEKKYNDSDLLTAYEAAEWLGAKSVQTVYHYIRTERLKAEKFGSQYMIKFEDLRKVERPDPKGGRPPKPNK